MSLDVPKLYALLQECKTKLQLYRDQHSGQYVGGVEFTVLRRRIDEALQELKQVGVGTTTNVTGDGRAR